MQHKMSATFTSGLAAHTYVTASPLEQERDRLREDRDAALDALTTTAALVREYQRAEIDRLAAPDPADLGSVFASFIADQDQAKTSEASDLLAFLGYQEN